MNLDELIRASFEAEAQKIKMSEAVSSDLLSRILLEHSKKNNSE